MSTFSLASGFRDMLTCPPRRYNSRLTERIGRWRLRLLRPHRRVEQQSGAPPPCNRTVPAAPSLGSVPAEPPAAPAVRPDRKSAGAGVADDHRVVPANRWTASAISSAQSSWRKCLPGNRIASSSPAASWACIP